MQTSERLKQILSFFAGLAVCLVLNGKLYRHSKLIRHEASPKRSRNVTGSRKPRIFCWISTDPQFHTTRAKAVRATWLGRCDGFVFGSTKADASLPAVDLGTPPGYEHLWAKTRSAFAYIHSEHGRDFDWFLKADDDTYVLVENLRKLLSPHSPEEKLWLGAQFKATITWAPHMSGGAGYVLSRAALEALVTEAFPSSDKFFWNRWCHPAAKDASEDVEIGNCLTGVGVQIIDSRDSEGRHRFLPAPLADHVAPVMQKKYADWLPDRMQYRLRQGPGCCSSSAVAFHYVTPEMMHVFEYFSYNFSLSESPGQKALASRPAR